MSARRAPAGRSRHGPTPTLPGTRFTGLIKGQSSRVRGHGPGRGRAQLSRQTPRPAPVAPRDRLGRGPVCPPLHPRVCTSPAHGHACRPPCCHQVRSVRPQNWALTGGRRPPRRWAHLLRPQLPLAGRVGRGVALLLQVDLHELVHGQLTGGGVFEFREPKTQMRHCPAAPNSH